LVSSFGNELLNQTVFICSIIEAVRVNEPPTIEVERFTTDAERVLLLNSATVGKNEQNSCVVCICDLWHQNLT